jgi:hypothetical protein
LIAHRQRIRVYPRLVRRVTTSQTRQSRTIITIIICKYNKPTPAHPDSRIDDGARKNTIETQRYSWPRAVVIFIFIDFGGFSWFSERTIST